MRVPPRWNDCDISYAMRRISLALSGQEPFKEAISDECWHLDRNNDWWGYFEDGNIAVDYRYATPELMSATETFLRYILHLDSIFHKRQTNV